MPVHLLEHDKLSFGSRCVCVLSFSNSPSGPSTWITCPLRRESYQREFFSLASCLPRTDYRFPTPVNVSPLPGPYLDLPWQNPSKHDGIPGPEGHSLVLSPLPSAPCRGFLCFFPVPVKVSAKTACSATCPLSFEIVLCERFLTFR